MVNLFPLQFSKYRLLLGLAFASLFITVACSTQNANQATPLVSGTNNWVGYAGHHIAVEKGFFKEQDVNVQDLFFSSESEEQTAFLAQKLDIAWFTSGTAVQVAAKDPTAKIVYLIDYSNGGDGIIGREIKSPMDLRGKTIAREDILFQKVLLRAYLSKEGLTEKDVAIKDMAAADAATAFASKQVDLAVSYEPYLRKAAQQGDGEVVFSTENTNLIADVVMIHDNVLQSRKADLKAYFRAVDKAVRLAIAADPEAMKITGDKLGISGEEVKEQLKLVKLFDIEGNKIIAFNKSNPNNLRSNLELNSKAAYDFKMIPQLLQVNQLYDDSIIKSL
ncbi:MAG: ABC transporter substrate-binding protein [Aphanocapsa sp. GSE-SYN-MK-11-07L]|nr:ABC transporter substrate-binding protein [Aphanocapsa sp. GSE-SYN-MK-11-07L]